MFLKGSVRSSKIYLYIKKIHVNIFIGQNREIQLQQRHTSGTQTTSCEEQGAYMLIDITQLWTSL